MKFGLFLGCNMPAIRPDVERSIRAGLPELGVELVDLEGYVCCPAFGTFASMDEDAQLASNAWNFSLAEERDVDLLAQCGSCYSSLKLGHHTLADHPDKKAKVTQMLGEVGRTYEGKANVRHMLDFLYNDLGPKTIRKSVKRQFKGIRAVVQYPCHTRFPGKVVGFEPSAGNPVGLRKLVEALGIEVVPYSLEYECCGGSGGFHKNAAPEAEEYAKRKMDAIKRETGADLIVTSCITCLMYMDRIQKVLTEKTDEEYAIPVFDYNQLLALAFDHPPEQVARISIIPREAVIERMLLL